MRRRKASLQLSIQAIVIIILAITLLGLGLTFMRQFFGKGSQELGEILDISKLENPASKNNPLTFKSVISGKPGETIEFEVGFYCDSSNDCTSYKPSLTACTPLMSQINQRILSPPVSVASHSSTGYKVILDTDGLDSPEQYICTLEVASTNLGQPSGQSQKEQIIVEME